MFCKKCGKEIDEEIKVCPYCGEKMGKKKRPVYKKWWFWVLMGLATIMTIAIISPSEEVSDISNNTSNSSQTTQKEENKSQGKEENKIEYVKTDLKTMLDELDENALKAERTYQDKYVEVVGEIANFDSDGSYISIEPVNADDWSFETVLCKIKNDDQLDFLLQKKKGDKVTIKGQIVSIGEILGYTIKIDEVY